MLDTSGLDDMIAQMRKMGENSGKMADAMVLAAGEEIKAAWVEVAERRRHRRSGAMIEAIGYAHEVKTISGIKYVDVYPQGKDGKGRKKPVRNATKAYVLHYGKKAWKTRSGDDWVDEADAKAEPRIAKKLPQMWEQYLKDGNVPT